MLHLLNGDATLAVFPATLPGRRAVWRDIMVEGPPLDDGSARAAWLEQDLFCAVNLWFVVARLPPSTRLSLVFPPLTDTSSGLGTLTASELGDLFERRRPLDGGERGDAAALWRASASSDPTALSETPAALAFAGEAVRLHLGRFPSTADGLDEIEAPTLRALVAGPRAFGELFRSVTHAPPHRRHGMGDVQYAAALRDLLPLIAIHDATAPFSGWTVTLTREGSEVLAGDLDGLTSRALDRWLGGVHIRPGAAGWRWDGERLVPR